MADWWLQNRWSINASISELKESTFFVRGINEEGGKYYNDRKYATFFGKILSVASYVPFFAYEESWLDYVQKLNRKKVENRLQNVKDNFWRQGKLFGKWNFAIFEGFAYYFYVLLWMERPEAEIDFARQFFRFYLLDHNHYAPETFKMWS